VSVGAYVIALTIGAALLALWAGARFPRLGPDTLVGASDRRFLRVASFLLGRNGFAVSGATRFADVMDAVESGRTDVVVLDASGPERWTVRAAAVLGHNDVAVAVLVVADDVEDSPGALPKWGSFDRLVDAIHRAHACLEPEVMPA